MAVSEAEKQADVMINANRKKARTSMDMSCNASLIRAEGATYISTQHVFYLPFGPTGEYTLHIIFRAH